MVGGLLFKWEDSPALNHHCGFCERPLSHPGARASCFGTHAEPCHRYHQIMFMRLRGHTCNSCLTIEEAHHRRHKKIAEQIRDLYDSCGVAEWTIIPFEPEARGRTRDLNMNLVEGDETDRSLTPEDVSSSKRDRKDAKGLARAANRARVISGDDISHIEAVIHSAEVRSGAECDGPRNTEELQEIDLHLKFNAHVYNTQSDRHELKKFARIPHVNVDFDTEIERILNTFRVHELLQRNIRNRGLQGKELKMFHNGVEDLKKALVEDLVLAKRDELETRMRRAGYLRYTNKIAYGIIQDRYTDKDWKTGEKYAITPGCSSETEPFAEEANSLLSTPTGISPPLRPAESQQGVDRRHLEHTHKRVTGDDGLGQNTIEPYHAPLLSMQSNSTPGKRAVQLRLVTDTPSVASSRMNKTPMQSKTNAYHTVLNGKMSTAPLVRPLSARPSSARPSSARPVWGMTASGRSVAPSPRPVNPWGPGATKIPGFHSAAQAVQPVDSAEFPSLKGPDGFLDDDKPAVDLTPTHPIVSQKKAKKYERDAQHKAKKSNLEDATGVVTQDEEIPAPEPMSTIENDPEIETPSEHDLSSTLPSVEIPIETAVGIVTPEAKVIPAGVHSEAIVVAQPPSHPVTSHDKHTNWVNFKRELVMDQFTAPILPSRSDHLHPTLCVCKTHGVLDCPFHPPYCSSCQDPLLDLVYLVYPSEKILQTGPYNRLHGQKLLDKYRQYEHLKNRIMLVDDELINYFMLDPQDRPRHLVKPNVLTRIAAEYAAHMKGSPPGPLMQQEALFDRMWNKNNTMKHEITQDMLMELRESVVVAGKPLMCYCQDVTPWDHSSKNVVECSHRDCRFKFFHKACIKDLGVEKVSRWYCTECNGRMQLLAHKILRDLGFENVPDDDTVPDNRTRLDALEVEYSQMDEAMSEMLTKLGRMPNSAELTRAIQRKLNQMVVTKK